MILDLTIAIIIIAAVIILYPRRQRISPQSIIGQQVIVKAGNRIIHKGRCNWVSSGDNVGECEADGRTLEGKYLFHVYVNALFWSEKDQAYIERV